MDSQCTAFHEDRSFDDGRTFEDLAEMTGIVALPELIDKHRTLVGEKFVSNADGMIFNGKKYGVYNLRFTRFGEEESPGVEVDLFETDYFTHKVFRSLPLPHHHERGALQDR